MCFTETYHFKNIIELERQLDTKEKCRAYIAQIRFKDGIQCPNCNSKGKFCHIKTKDVIKCSKCRKTFPSTQGTIFENSNMDIRIWFKTMIYLLHGTSSNKIHEFICVAPNTATLSLRKIRHAISKHIDKMVLHGKVEVDECWYGPKRIEDLRLPKGWHKFRQRVLLGMKLREQKDKDGKTIQPAQIIIRLIGNNTKVIDADVVVPILEKFIHPDSTIVTDGNNIYDHLKDSFKEHEVAIHNIPTEKENKKKKTKYTWNMKKFVYYVVLPDGTKKRIHTNGIESTWRQWHRKNDDHQSASYSHLQSYIDEFSFLYNIRHLSLVERFNLLLSICCETSVKESDLKEHFILKVKYKDVRGRVRNRLMSNLRAQEAYKTMKINFSHYL